MSEQLEEEYRHQIRALQDNVHSLQTMLHARQEIQRQKFERITSMLREVMVVLETYTRVERGPL